MRLALLLVVAAAALPAQDAAFYNRRGEDHFRKGHIAESLADFDRAIRMDPRMAPHHWQRGISLYYAGRYEDGIRQFESHRTVNPDDVENAAWWLLCMARAGRLAEAQRKMLPVGPDARIPMREIYDYYRGKGSAGDVLAAAERSPHRESLFYAHLYLGLFADATGDRDSARNHLDLAVNRYGANHYMGDVARVHLRRLESLPRR